MSRAGRKLLLLSRLDRDVTFFLSSTKEQDIFVTENFINLRHLPLSEFGSSVRPKIKKALYERSS